MKKKIFAICAVILICGFMFFKLFNYQKYKKEKPVVELKGNSVILLNVGDKFKEPGYTANDKLDGDITKMVTVTGDKVDTSKSGIYKIHYNVKSKRGTQSIQVTRVINVKDKEEKFDPNAKLKDMIKKEVKANEEKIRSFKKVCDMVDYMTEVVYAYYDEGEKPEREVFRPLVKIALKEELGIE